MNQLDLKGRVAVITGGAQGIGYATAERMLNSGASVVLWDIDAALLAQAKKTFGQLGRVGTAQVELTDESAVSNAAAQATAEFGSFTSRSRSGCASACRLWSRSCLVCSPRINSFGRITCKEINIEF